jgi:hypothetical protein
MTNIKEITKGVVNTLNPKGGHGVVESIISIMIVATVLYCAVKGVEIPVLIATAFGTVLGWLFKNNSKED